MDRRKVLIVDDSTSLCQGLSLLLSPDYSVASVASGEEALSIVEEFDPDVVLLDLRLPGILGEEVLRVLKRKRPDIPIMVMTGVPDTGAADRVSRLGAADYLRKPFGLSLLRRRLEDVLEA